MSSIFAYIDIAISFYLRASVKITLQLPIPLPQQLSFPMRAMEINKEEYDVITQSNAAPSRLLYQSSLKLLVVIIVAGLIWDFEGGWEET